jgi:hypothetical protein
MPFALIAAGIAALLFLRNRPPGSAVPTYDGTLLQGAQSYMPPINAPQDLKVAFANAMFRKNPIEMVQVAQQIMAQYPQFSMLAQQLSASYAQLTNNPIPGIPVSAAAAGHIPFSIIGALPPAHIARLRRLQNVRKHNRRAELMKRMHAAKHWQNT